MIENGSNNSKILLDRNHCIYLTLKNMEDFTFIGKNKVNLDFLHPAKTSGDFPFKVAIDRKNCPHSSFLLFGAQLRSRGSYDNRCGTLLDTFPKI